MALTSKTSDTTLSEKQIECLKQSVVNTFSMICGDSPVPMELPDNDAAAKESILGIISLVGDEVWSVMLQIPKGTAPSMAETFAGMEISFDSPDMGDVVGELVNILAGDLSARLDSIGLKMELSLPTVIRGNGLQLMNSAASPITRLGFKCSKGNFELLVQTGTNPDLLTRKSGV